jgi:hypothetical protein
LSVNADNILNSRQPLLITEATNNQVSSNPATSLDQYQYQAPMSIMFNLKAHL